MIVHKFEYLHVEAHCELEEPQNADEALTKPEAKEWQIGIDEIAAMKKNNTWESIDQLPKNHKVVSSKIVFKKKLDGQGRVEKIRLDWWLEDLRNLLD